ncbi:MAG: 2-amino-4-hydroxy-6-hydroxymethyldihydropteridine diphosphokinase [Pseudomonadales bacterium]|jgi:2-amino-4-hydroxy-6-hydroxymethyldihydropteridine diphosphokinase|nr:2-amino-4-hydroxy-6-hydroxymethyldihydropteridine diphosphokinase [Pseudomonadales bacterium]
MKTWTRSFIGLGSNLNDPVQQIQRACEQLGKIPQCSRKKVSGFYISEPLRSSSAAAKPNQPNYINAVAEIHTQLNAERLLDELQQIEQQQGRTRSHKRWQSRTLDLDILLFGDQQILSERLQIPHPEMLNRNFVVIPLAELTNDLILPCGQSLRTALNKADFEPLKIVANFQDQIQPGTEHISTSNPQGRRGHPA